MATSSDTWFVMIPPTYASKSTAEKELVDFRVQYQSSSQAWTDANAGRILSPAESGEGQQLVKWQGPFATEADAKAAQNPQQQSTNPLNDATNAAENSNVVSDPLGTLAGFLGIKWAKGAGSHIVIRATKIIIGGTLVIVGISHLTGADNAVANVARKLPLPI
jgi:hypothetical protein